jgi:methionyl-tRNA formyltransferase
MRILVVSPAVEKILPALKEYDDEIIIWGLNEGKINVDFLRDKKIDLIVCFGYDHIFRSSEIDYCPIINLHPSYLPWNRGPFPNFWSWLTDSPKGVTIHYIDAGVDTGDIIAQKQLENLHDGMTLYQTHLATLDAIAELFAETWTLIREGKSQRYPQLGQGSYHTKRDILPFQDILKNSSPDTPIREIIAAIKSQIDIDRIYGTRSQVDFWTRMSERSRRQVKPEKAV